MILDIMLPDGSGVQLLQEIRGAGLNVRVAIVTGLADNPAVMSQLKAVKPDAIFSKPLHPGRWLSDEPV